MCQPFEEVRDPLQGKLPVGYAFCHSTGQGAALYEVHDDAWSTVGKVKDMAHAHEPVMRVACRLRGFTAKAIGRARLEQLLGPQDLERDAVARLDVDGKVYDSPTAKAEYALHGVAVCDVALVVRLALVDR